jgi:tetratricopeptide (TPR) repeat protein
MKLSEQPEYLVAIPAATRRDFSAARENLEVLLNRAEAEGDIGTLGYLLQTLGDVEAHSGNHQRAIELHQKAISLDPNSPLPYLFYARGLFRAFGDPDASLVALSKAENILATVWQDDENELPRSYYEREFQSLKDEIINVG